MTAPKRLGSLVLAAATASAALTASRSANADDFAAGSLIIPMDTTYQDFGMFRAYGLLYELLRNNVPVRWVINPNKMHSGIDFFASSDDYATAVSLGSHGYRGGPFVVDAADALAAQSIIDDWIVLYPETAVHITTMSFTADVSKYLENAPKVAMFADGNQKVARGYLEAAGIPDSTLDLEWPDSSPDMLTVAEVSGPTTTDHADGELFDDEGDPAYCQFMSMHWGVGDAEDDPEVVAEVREFLTHPTHFFAECQAVNAFENLSPHGFFLTPNGFDIMGKPNDVDHHHHDSPFAQLDGVFGTVGGSEPAYALPPGDAYKAGDITMITAQGFAEGQWDVWMTGYLDGLCPPEAEECGGIGKVSYLGGHEYKTDTPISNNEDSQGTRLFLNSLFDSECATAQGAPTIQLTKQAPDMTTDATVTFTINYWNLGPTVAFDAVLVDELPAGATFVSATAGGIHNTGTVSWSLGNLGLDEAGSVTVTVTLGAFGSFDNDAELMYAVGVTDKVLMSNMTTTVYGADGDGDGVVDTLDNCPNDYNPNQDLQNDIESCGMCGTVCAVADGTPECVAGVCGILTCDAGFSDCNSDYTDGCEYDDTNFQTDVGNCGACTNVCTVANGTPECAAGNCAVLSCDAGFSDCNTDYTDGCEYDEGNFQTDVDNCGGCDAVCTAANGVPECAAGMCEVLSCDAGFSDCNADYIDGCEYDEAGFQTDLDHCGACNNMCAVANGTPECATGMCEVLSCDAGFSDCNTDYTDGCEIDDTSFPTNTDHCGGCNLACTVANGSPECVAGNCGILTCDAGFTDCNADYTDGCEYDDTGFQTDLNNCGTCDNICSVANGTPECVAGSCGVLSCDAGFSDCNADYTDGCEYDDVGFQTDVAHCGACGNVCAVANGTPECAAGVCGVLSCDGGFSDCNADYMDGCEIDDATFQTDSNHCGSCNNVCSFANASALCMNGTCAMGACDADWIDQDMDPTNGCEQYVCTAIAADDTTCDGVDDDCDTLIDDDFVAGTCGVGACASPESCMDGMLTCTPGAPSAEGPTGDATCGDGIDNDCDGDSDVGDSDCAPMGAGGSGAGGSGASSGGNASGGDSAGGSAPTGGANAGGSTSSSGSGSSTGGNAAAGEPDAESGCSCEVAGAVPDRTSAGWLLTALAAGLVRRRQRRRTFR